MITFTLAGQLPSGKNAVKITRKGHRYPAKRFKVWRDAAVQEITIQKAYLKRKGVQLPLTRPLKLVASYTPSDRRIRDLPGMLDAILHVLERAGIVANDGQVIGNAWEQQQVDKQKAGVSFALYEYGGGACDSTT